MPCKNCQTKPVIKLHSGVGLCKKCFIRYFEKKVFKTIGKHKLVEKSDKKVAVAVSGGKDSLTVLNILNNLAEKKRTLQIVAILIDEGIRGYRNFTIKDAKKFCKEKKIELKCYSFKKEFGHTLDQMVKKLKGVGPCTICGILRRYLLNIKSRKLKADKLVTGHNLDDEAQAILMNQFRRNMETSARLGPLTGVVKDPRFIRRIKPLYFLTEKEVTTYAFLKRFVGKWVECPHDIYSYRSGVRDMLNNFEAKHSGTKHSIISSFMEILPLLKKNYSTKEAIKACTVCKEPCSLGICNACQIIKKLKRG